ncbi:hypothetical protein [Thiomonas sp. FB-6]|uniref:hypothetical protein n=1 Tax=Thiomonas sp. FB-6 TaxID=1158291 RepID=UPI0003813504|nr:hypothetical protein [Thiomonas sp. FB-6]
MKKLLQLMFGDWRNAGAVAASAAAAYAAARAWPGVGAWLLVPALLLAAWWQASA